MTTGETLDRDKLVKEFKAAVNMTPGEITRWLGTDESREVGWKGEDGDGDGESIGHASGRRIVDLLGTAKGELSDDDLKHMRKVTGYVARHSGQKPAHPEGSRWAASLKNWGHDPMKKEAK